MATIDNNIGDLFLSNKNLEQKFLRIIAKYIPQSKIYKDVFSVLSKGLSTKIGTIEFKDLPIYKILSEENNFKEFVRFLQSIFWLDLNSEIKEKLYWGFKEDIELSMLEIQIKKANKTNIIFYPKGAKLLDEKLVNDNLDWLSGYPGIYKPFKNALELYQEKKYTRELLDNLRFSLEQFLKTVLELKKPYNKKLGNYFKGKKISPEIRNMYTTVYSYFEGYQNENVKHNENFNPLEIEFIIYLTGTFIRFLTQTKEEK